MLHDPAPERRSDEHASMAPLRRARRRRVPLLSLLSLLAAVAQIMADAAGVGAAAEVDAAAVEIAARCGVRLRKLPLDSSGAELLRRHTAPEGWSGVLLLTLDRHPSRRTPYCCAGNALEPPFALSPSRRLGFCTLRRIPHRPTDLSGAREECARQSAGPTVRPLAIWHELISCTLGCLGTERA